jgi:hypothetical protein
VQKYPLCDRIIDAFGRAWLLIALLVPVTFLMHGFWRLSDPQAIHVQAMFAKNIAMLAPLYC